MGKIIVIDADAAERARLREKIEQDGHWVVSLPDSDRINNWILSHHPDLIVVGPNASDAHRPAAANIGPRVPVLILSSGSPVSSTSSETDHIFIADPVSTDLTPLVRHLLERNSATDDDRRWLRLGHLELDRDTRTVRLGIASVSDVPIKHFEVLWLLARRAKDNKPLCPRSLLISRLWKTQVRDREVDVTISRLKTRLPFLSAYIETVPGKGYRLVSPSLSPRPSTAAAASRIA